MTQRYDSWADRAVDAIIPWFVLFFMLAIAIGVALLIAAGLWAAFA